MHAASREALAALDKFVDSALFGIDNGVAVAAQTGAELFDVVEVLDTDRALRVAVADSSADAEKRSGLMRAVFGGKVSQLTLDVLTFAAAQTWSTPREMRAGLVACGRRALLRSAEYQGQLGAVESELFQLSRVLDNEAQLTQLLSDRTATPSAKRDLLAKVLYGKVSAVTEALALQVIGRPEHNPIDDMASLADTVAALQGRQVAHVVAATALDAGQEKALEEKLGRIYGRAMSIHTEVDPSLLGGMVIRVGDEVIDGSTSGKLERLRTAMV
ncbi:F0F1 ATP synthase subunit delta [Corynebacterium sp. 13CS0277]|uniref:F0F1 ATP synthase subunit delta n=1 Tax=Corynebacterium sp. 13CS0277 TaxID=2071994 RepID=UPI000D04145A|nr:F0F1 ATP synthase subunit delta [Corynebacterium sp. 13CS0277]PRQ12339.1 F0F1 ATP synthase subunit delta [Corynebacterium sp. 13CS0277]